ncbi:MAG TPA: phosphoribosylglycinamide formyltransferase [Mariprofundaceae bacterium]|nr:phosphoribosylglycinamide formyltransferase [Mariprofundaceae bacterium]
MKQPRIAVLASGKGSNLQAILEAVRKGECPVEVALVLSDRAEAGALQIARDAGVASVVALDPKAYPDRAAFDMACGDAIEAVGCEWVVLAGYMRILSGAFIARFHNRIINIHPSLLPSFIGAHAVRDALAYGVKVTGASVHLVNEVLDGGPILAQAVVPVHDDDSEEALHQRIHEAEHRLYPATISRMVREGFAIEGRRVIWRRQN